jgi:hypothetical protein
VRAAIEDDAAIWAQLVGEARGLPARVLLAEPALERRSEPLSPTLRIEHPWPLLKRRPVPHVPLVAAGELGDPVAALVLVVTDDCAFHAHA